MNHPHTTFPPLLVGYPLDTDMGLFIPESTINVVTNPSFETNTTSWSASAGGTSIARVATQQYSGAWSLEVTPAAKAKGATYKAFTTAAAGLYTASLYLKGRGGSSYQIVIQDGAGGTIDTGRLVLATGKWQRLTHTWTDATGGTRWLHVLISDGSLSPFYLDAVQIEAKGHVTSYCDGDQPGLIDNPGSPAYLWDGTPHASTSRRSAMTRAGGAFKTFAELGLVISSIVGLGLPVPNNASIPYGLLDGALYQRSTTPARQFSVIGRVDGLTPLDLDRKRAALEDALRYDAVTPAQPVTLVYHTPAGDERRLEAVYQSGLERKNDNLYAEQTPVTFTAYMPFVIAGGAAGAELTTRATITPTYALRRSPSGVWDVWGALTGATPAIAALEIGLDGKIYVGGSFATIGGVAAANIAVYDPVAGTFAALGAGVDANVYSIAIGADGKVYCGGAFVNAGGAAANRVAVWDPAGGTWATLGAGAGGGFSGVVSTVKFSRTGVLWAGGIFVTANGVTMNGLAYLSAGTWAAVGTGLAGGTAQAFTLAQDWATAGDMFVAGDFTTANGVTVNRVARVDTTTFYALETGANNAVYSLGVVNNKLYASGTFTTIGTVTTPFYGQWNGSQWQAVGAGGVSGGAGLRVSPVGDIFFGGGAASLTGTPDLLVVYRGGRFYPVESHSAGVPLVTPDGTWYMSGPIVAKTYGAVTSVANSGQADAYPLVVVNGPGAVWALLNATTGQGMWFDNLTLQTGEKLTIDLTPGKKTITSNWRGNMAGYLIPGSDLATWKLTSGANNVSLFVDDAAATAWMSFLPLYRSVSR